MKKQRILVAEDNIMNHKLIEYYLKKSGYTADFVSNGFEVLSALEHNSYDLILMDLQMPEMDGFMTTRKIRDRETEGEHIPIIALTAHALKENRDRSVEYGMDGYVTKPVDRKELMESIERILANKGEKSGISENSDYIVLDKSLLYEISCGDEELIKEAINIFLSDTPLLLEEIKYLACKGHMDLIKEKAHKIKGMSINIGGLTLQSVANDIEIMARNKKLDTINESIEKLYVEFERLKVILSSI